MLNTERYYMPAARKNQEKRPAVQQILHNFRYTSHNFQNIFNFLFYARKNTDAPEGGPALWPRYRKKTKASRARRVIRMQRPGYEKPKTASENSESRPRRTARAATFFLIGF